MKTAILKLNNEDVKRNIFWVTFALVLVSVVFYIYFVIATVKNVVVRENLEIRNGELALEVGMKEFDFINLKNNVTLSLAELKGFKEVKDKTYITSRSLGFAPKANEF